MGNLGGGSSWSDSAGSTAGKSTIGAPGFWESLIPVWGPARQAIHEFQQGNYGWGIFNTVVAVSEVFLLRAIVTGIVKGVARGVGKSGAKQVANGGKYSEWLNKGPGNVSVYKGYNRGQDVYIGITNNIANRQTQHGARFTLREMTSDLTRNKARAIEQILIERNPQYLNKINSISPKHRYYNDATNWAKDWLINKGY